MSMNIIEVLSDGKYRLFEDNLKQILSKVLECDKFAIISIIGSRKSGKSFIQNCIIDYIKCEDKSIWPKNGVIYPKNGFNGLSEENRKLIKIFSEPLIVESNGEKTAVILMDTNNVFKDCVIHYDDLIESIIGLFLTTSSTFIFIKDTTLWADDIRSFEKVIEKAVESNGGHMFEQLVMMIFDWSGWMFKLEGVKYLKTRLLNTRIENYFKRIDVSIIPKVTITSRMDMNRINYSVNHGLAQTFRSLFDSDQMSVKTYPNSDQPITIKDIFLLFRSYVNKLNGESISTNTSFGQFNQEQVVEMLEENVDQNTVNTISETGIKIQDLEDKLKSKVSNDSHIDNPNNSSSDICECDSKKDLSDNNYANDCQMKDTSDNDKSTDDIEVQESDKSVVNIDDIVDKLLSKNKININSLFDKNLEQFNLNSEFALPKNQWNKISKELKENLKNIDDEIVKQTTSCLNSKISEIIAELNSRKDVIRSQLISSYNHLVDECIDKYKAKFIEKIESNVKVIGIDMKKIHQSCADITKESFGEKYSDEKVKNNKMRNQSLEDLSSRLENGWKSIELVNNYISEWEDSFKTNPLFEEHVLNIKHDGHKKFVFETKTGQQYQEFHPMIKQIIDRVFEDIKSGNQRLINEGNQLTQVLTDRAIERIWQHFEHQLKSGSYDHNRVELMFKRLVNYAVTVIADINEVNNTNSLQNQMNSLKTTDKYNTICSNYFRTKAEMKSVSDTASREAIASYSRQIFDFMNKRPSLSKKDLLEQSYQVKNMVVQNSLSRLSSFKQYYDQKYFSTLSSDFTTKTMKEIKKNENSFLTKCKESDEELATILTADNKTDIANTNDSEVTDKINSLVLSVYFSHKTIFGAISDDNIQNVFDISSPNCIAIDEEILFGREAEEFAASRNKIREFDIKRLIMIRTNHGTSNTEMNVYPFYLSFKDDFLKVKFQNNWLRIETLIALQVLDIKSKVEKELSINIKRGLFVVPNHCVHFRDNFKLFSPIADLETVDILSELTAAAIGYCHIHKPTNETQVLLIAINDMKCDAAVVTLNHKSITYQNFWHKGLDIYEKRYGMFNPMNFFGSDPKLAEKIEKSIIKMFDYFFPKSKFYKYKILVSDIIVVGTSSQMDYIVKQISNHCPGKDIICKDSNNFVLTGAHIYGKYAIEGNEEFRYDVKEVAFHDFTFKMKIKGLPLYENSIAIRGQRLPNSSFHTLNCPQSRELPITINIIHDDKQIVQTFEIVALSEYYLKNLDSYYWRHKIHLNVDELGIVHMQTLMHSNQNTSDCNTFAEIPLISSNDMETDKKFIDSLRTQKQKAEEENRISKEAKEKIKQLKPVSQRMREKFQNNCGDMTRLKKKRIESQLNDIEQTLDSSDIHKLEELDVIVKQLKELDQLIE